MATVRTAIQMYDGMTPALRSMTNAMNIVINSFEAMQTASSTAVDTSAIRSAREELNKAEIAFNGIEREIKEADAAQQRFNNEIRNGQIATDGLGSKIKSMVGAFLGVAAVRKGVGAIGEWLGLADVQIASEKQLATVMANMGAIGDEFESIKKTAAEIQLRTTFGDEALLGGAAELATYLKSGDAIEAMMGTLANYAAGMGGMEVNKGAMVEYATQIGKALDGQFDGLRKKGFDVTDAQKAIIENGTEMERVAVITDIIAQSWDGLAESLANTPQGQIIQMQNAFGDIKETVGMYLYPAVLQFFSVLNSNMPVAEQLMMGFASSLIIVMNVLGYIVNGASVVVGFFINNWSLIAPVVLGVAAAFLIWKGAILVMTAAQWALNGAMLASPITWIILAVIVLVTVINMFTDAGVSATGIITGAFAVLGAFLWNLFLGVLELVLGVVNYMINPFVDLANFIGNVFTNPVSSIIYLFQGMADNVLGVLEKIASAIDFITGANMADTISGWRSGLKNMADEAVARYAPDENYQRIIDKVDFNVDDLGLKRLAYGDAYDAGYKFGENLESAFDMSNVMSPGIDDLDYLTYNAKQLDELGEISDNTGSIKDSIEISEEDLKYLRDIAEREVIDRTVLRDVTVTLSNSFGDIRETADLAGVVRYLEEELSERLFASAEGVHASV